MEAHELRSAMVAGLLAGGRIRSSPVERAFRAVPRHPFLPQTPLERAYADEAVVTKWENGVAVSSASQPAMMAIMLEQLELRPGHRVLEVGAGTGYNAALMASLVGRRGRVAAVDIDADLTENAARNLAAAGLDADSGAVTLATRDGALGYPELAPYDRIVLTVASADIQPAWWAQLAPGGRLLLPLSVRGSQLSVALDLVTGPAAEQPHLRSVSVRGCAFVRLRGQGAGPAPYLVLAEGLAVQAGDDAVPDPEALVALLEQPATARGSPVRLSPIDLWDGLGLWLSVTEPHAVRLLVGASGPGQQRFGWLGLFPAGPDAGTLGLAAERGLAVLVPDGHALGGQRLPAAIRACGPDGPRQAARLAGCLQRWLAQGRPAASRLRLRIHPGASPAAPEGTGCGGATVVRTEHSRVILEWDEAPGRSRPGPARARRSRLQR